MAIIFDQKKNAKNIARRDLSFESVEWLDWSTALIDRDARNDYGETRFQVLALLRGCLHLAVVTPRDGDLRVISFRKANKREVKRYAEDQRRSGLSP